MATHLVYHEVSHVVVELSEDDLASPLGYLYHPVKTNKNGKHYVTKDGQPVLLDGRNSSYLDPTLKPSPETVAAEKSDEEKAAEKAAAEEEARIAQELADAETQKAQETK